MCAADAALWFSAGLNAATVAILAVRYRLHVKAGSITERKAKTIYSWLCLATGLFSGTVIFFGIMHLFNIPAGHGEVLIASPVLNLLLSGILIVAGRTVIGWTPMKW